MTYSELQITSNFSFLRGGSHPEELVEHARNLGYTAIAITDRNTLAGIVRAHAAAKGKNIRVIPACRLDLEDGPSLLVYPTAKNGYTALSGLLTKGNLQTEKGKCKLEKADLPELGSEVICIVVPPVALNASFDFEADFRTAVRDYREIFGGNLYLGAICTYQGDDAKRLYRISELAEATGVPMVATNDVHYHCASRRELQDVLTCVREKCTIREAGYRLCQNAERYLKPAVEMQRLFRLYPDAIERTTEIANACGFSLDSLKYLYPEELCHEGRTPQAELEFLTWRGAQDRWAKDVIPKKIIETLKMELDFIRRRNYASYFLTVHDFVNFARKRKILCQGRGSAANSVVCYCLKITSVDPSKFSVLFARFMSDARDEPPDIDVDFEHERREEVMQYIFNKYGRDRAAIVATVTQLHTKGAIRDVGKVMGLSTDAIGRLSGSLWEFGDEWLDGRKISSEGFDARDPQLIKILQLTSQYIGFPRQLGQHTGGFVITQDKISDFCPVLNAHMADRTCIEWNKDDIDALGFMKVDVLALGMLTCIRKAFDLAKAHHGMDLNMADINKEDDPKVYEMISAADTLGVFQIESRAQMSMLPRLRPQCFYDLVIEVAIVRPGPIQGDMVHPYLRRRQGLEKPDYAKPELEAILQRTLGVPLFQEQAMEIAIVGAGFTPAEADGLRRSMASFKSHGKIRIWEEKLIGGMLAKGYTEQFAKRVFRQLEGFGSYGFPESHAASFALLVYVSCWLKYYLPDVFATALLNSMPMGFYQPAQIVIDARKHGVEFRPVDINHSFWDNNLEEKLSAHCPVRLGFRQVKGLKEEEMQQLVGARGEGFKTVPELIDIGLSPAALEKLADADAFRSIGLDRRQALWEVAALQDRPTGMYQGQNAAAEAEQELTLPELSLAEHVVQDYGSTTLSLKAHPVSFVREKLKPFQIRKNSELSQIEDGTYVKVAGLVLVRQRPGTASGICFITIEDESGVANLVVFKDRFDRYRKEIVTSRLLMVAGKLQREGEVIHVVVQYCMNMSSLLQEMTIGTQDENSMMSLSRADEKDDADHADPRVRKSKNPQAVQAEIFPDGRNFR